MSVFAAALLLYALTCAPGALWQDSGMYQYRIWHSDIKGGLGLALSHPSYHILGIAVRGLPLGEYGRRVNMMSAVFGALTVANIFLFVLLWTRKNIPAVLSAVTLAVGWTFWQNSVIAEVYTLYTAIFSLELIFLLLYFKTEKKLWLYFLALCNGLAIANHLWALLPLVCYIILLAWLLFKKKIRAKTILLFIILLMIGAAPYEYLIIQELAGPSTFKEVLNSALFGNTWSDAVLNTKITARIAAENLIYIFYNFPTPNIIFAVLGGIVLYKHPHSKPFSITFAAITLLFFVFAFRYTVPDRYAFFIPFYCMVSILIGLGAERFFQMHPPKKLVIAVFLLSLLPLPVYFAAPRIAQAKQVDLGTSRSIPYRNQYHYFLTPWKNTENSPQRFAAEALLQTNNEGIIIADGTTVYPLWYAQTLKGQNNQTRIFSLHGSYKNPSPFPDNERIERLIKDTHIYVVSPVKGYCPGFILERYRFEKQGVLYKMLEKK